MGHGESKAAYERLGDAGDGVKIICQLLAGMRRELEIPAEISDRFYLKFQKYVGLRDSKGEAYCCEVEIVDGKCSLTKGWGDLLTTVGAQNGDIMVFDIKSADETVIWVFKSDAGIELLTGDGNKLEEDLGANMLGEDAGIAMAAAGYSLHDAKNGSGSGTDGGDNTVELMQSWREKFYLGANVELEDWMVEFVASGLDWEMPEVKIFVGRVEKSSITSNRMRLPRGYTSENVLPLLKSKNEVFVLQLKYDEDRCVQFSIAKDGRAVFTKGWSAFTVESDIGPGSVLAFIFGRKNTELDIEIDVLKRTT